MADDEDGPRSVNVEDPPSQVALQHQADLAEADDTSNVEDWANIAARARIRSGCTEQRAEEDKTQSSSISFRESHGLVRCSVKVKTVGKEARSKKQKLEKVQTDKDVLVSNTQIPAPGRPRLSEPAFALETQSSAAPEISLNPRLAASKSDEKCNTSDQIGPVYDACSTRGVDFTWERDEVTHQDSSKSSFPRPSQHGSDKAIPPENIIRPPVTTSKRKTGNASQFFNSPSPKKPRAAAGTVSCIDVPPLSNHVFGLIQEELAHHPFQLLVAVILLNKTRGKYAIPVFREIMEAYPTPQALEEADLASLSEMIKPLGLFNQRAATLVELAKVWNLHPPTKGRRVMTPKYPGSESHKGIGALEVLGDDDTREGALEIGHLPGIGAYAFDSWRIFSRDELREVAVGWNAEGATDESFVPEWKRVLPNDKELRAFLRWMWLKEGLKWDPITGEKEIASAKLMTRAESGGLNWEEVDTM